MCTDGPHAEQHLRRIWEDYNSRRGRYIGYIINLTVKAFLFSQDTEAFKSKAKGVNELTLCDSERIKIAQKA